MSIPPGSSSRDGPQAEHLAALLREGPWIRRLALGLLGSDAAADDLSQDILLVAMTQGPGVELSRLRAWLRTVARRLVARRRERERAREAVERRAARPEVVERETHDRLQLHRQLATAIDGLAPPYRAALVLRYLEGLPPREIAVRLDLTPAAARKRVSRGLVMLREVLDAEHGGDRARWSNAVAALLTPGGGPAPVPPALPVPLSPAAALPLFALMTKKMLLVALTVAAAAGVLLLADPFGKPTPASVVGAVGEASTALEDLPGGERAEAVSASDGDTRRAAVEASPHARAPMVRVVQAGGGPVLEAGVAWVDPAGHPHGLELDGEGQVARPEGSAGAYFFACAPGFAEAFVRAGAADEDAEIVLEPERVLRGRIVEDGGPPTDSLYLSALDFDDSRGVPDVWGMRSKLVQLGALRSGPRAWTQPDGSFELKGLRPGSRGSLSLPTTHRQIVGGVPVKEGRVRYGGDDRELVIETVLLPRILGRLVWADDGLPVVGSLYLIVEERGGSSSFATSGQADAQGAFTIGLPVSERALLEPPEARPAGLLYGAVRIFLNDVNGTPMPFERRVELEGETFPIDLGVVPVARAQVLTARVVGPEGQPVEGAAVVSTLDDQVSDADGQVQLALQWGEQIQVLAPGYAYSVFTPESADLAEAPFELRLEPGHTLAVVLASKDGAGPDVSIPVQLAWEQSPFEGAHITGEPPFDAMPPRVHRCFHRGVLIDGMGSFAREGAPGSQGFIPPPDGVLLIPGLRAGSSFTLSLVDRLGQTLVERAITMPPETGQYRVDLGGSAEGDSRLRVRMVDPSGAPLKVHGRVHVLRGDGRLGRGFQFEEGLLDKVMATGTYTLSTQVSGYLPHEIEGYSLFPESPVLELALEASRRLEVRFVDDTNRPLAAQSVRIETGDGWSARAEETTLGRAIFRSVPLRPLELHLEVGTRTHTEAVDAQQELVTVTLPAHGRLSIQLAPGLESTTDGAEIRARIRETEGDRSLELSRWYDKADVEGLELETDLLPGSYELRVDLVEWPEGALESDEPFVRSLDQRTFTIKAGQATRVEIAE
jgi:RNA polymerase sigma factor (sigma-70 family)